MFKKLLVVLFILFIFTSTNHVNAEDFNYVEIFDPRQDKVVKVVQSNPQIQNMITKWILNIEGLYKNDPATDDGYVVKIPLNPAVKVTCEYLNTSVREVYILIPENEAPCYLIFENKNRLLSLPFNGDIDMLSQALDFKLKK